MTDIYLSREQASRRMDELLERENFPTAFSSLADDGLLGPFMALIAMQEAPLARGYLIGLLERKTQG